MQIKNGNKISQKIILEWALKCQLPAQTAQEPLSTSLPKNLAPLHRGFPPDTSVLLLNKTGKASPSVSATGMALHSVSATETVVPASTGLDFGFIKDSGRNSGRSSGSLMYPVMDMDMAMAQGCRYDPRVIWSINPGGDGMIWSSYRVTVE